MGRLWAAHGTLEQKMAVMYDNLKNLGGNQITFQDFSGRDPAHLAVITGKPVYVRFRYPERAESYMLESGRQYMNHFYELTNNVFPEIRSLVELHLIDRRIYWVPSMMFSPTSALKILRTLVSNNSMIYIENVNSRTFIRYSEDCSRMNIPSTVENIERMRELLKTDDISAFTQMYETSNEQTSPTEVSYETVTRRFTNND